VEVLDEQAGAYTEHQVNNYFVTHPENVLGEYRSGHGMHNAATLEVRTTSAEDVLAERVSDRLATITAAAVEAGLGLSAMAETTTTLDAATFDQGLVTSATLARSAPEGSLRYHADSGRIQRWDGQ